MNIYKITRKTNSKYYDSIIEFVCFAENEEQAMNLNPKDYKFLYYDEEYRIYLGWADWEYNLNELNVIKLGVSDSVKKPQIISVCFTMG